MSRNKGFLALKALLLTLSLVFTPLFASANDAVSDEDVKRVYMVLWRGVTDAERGFMDALMGQNHPVEFIVRNAAKSRDTLKKIRADILRQQPGIQLWYHGDFCASRYRS